MGWNHSIDKIAILISLWFAGIIVMVIILRSFCKQCRVEPDSHYGTENPAEDKKD